KARGEILARRVVLGGAPPHRSPACGRLPLIFLAITTGPCVRLLLCCHADSLQSLFWAGTSITHPTLLYAVSRPAPGEARTALVLSRGRTMAFNPFTSFRKYQKFWMAAILLVCMATFVLCTGVGGDFGDRLLRLFSGGGRGAARLYSRNI